MRRLIAAAGGLVCTLGIAAASAGAPVIAATPPMPSVMPLAPSGGSSHSTKPAPTAVLTPESASGPAVAAVLPTPTAGQVAPAVVTPTPQPEVLPAATEATAPTETTAPTAPTAPAPPVPPAPPAAPVCIDASQLVPLLDESDVQAVDEATGLPMWLLEDDSGTVVLGDACPMPTPQPPAVPVQVP